MPRRAVGEYWTTTTTTSTRMQRETNGECCKCYCPLTRHWTAGTWGSDYAVRAGNSTDELTWFLRRRAWLAGDSSSKALKGARILWSYPINLCNLCNWDNFLPLIQLKFNLEAKVCSHMRLSGEDRIERFQRLPVDLEPRRGARIDSLIWELRKLKSAVIWNHSESECKTWKMMGCDDGVQVMGWLSTEAAVRGSLSWPGLHVSQDSSRGTSRRCQTDELDWKIHLIERWGFQLELWTLNSKVRP